VRIKGITVEEMRAAIESERGTLDVGDERIAEIIGAATTAVDAALADGSYVRVFRGKQLLRVVYAGLGLGDAQVSYDRFCYALAGRCADLPTVRALVNSVFCRLEASGEAPSAGKT
jgi:hypothetical protein